MVAPRQEKLVKTKAGARKAGGGTKAAYSAGRNYTRYSNASRFKDEEVD
jgi:hypothetical protein